MEKSDIVFLYDPSVPEGTGHGTVIRKLFPLIKQYCAKINISTTFIPLDLAKFKGRGGYYLRTWARRLALCPSGKIVHAFDPGWATLNTNFLTYYDIWPLKLPQHGIKGIGDKIDWKMRIFSLKKAECVLSISEWSKQELVAYSHVNPKKIHVVRLGIDHDKYYPVKEKGEYFSNSKINILSVGSNEPRKNFILVAKALECLKEKGIEARFVRFGPSIWKQQAEEIEELKRKKNLDIIEPGIVSEDVLRRHYSSCDVFVWPSIYIESLATLEALACGAKAVVLDRVFNREFLGDVPIYVKNNDPVEFAEGIMEALKTNLGEKGILHAKQYSWERTAAEYVRHYTAFLKRHS